MHLHTDFPSRLSLSLALSGLFAVSFVLFELAPGALLSPSCLLASFALHLFGPENVSPHFGAIALSILFERVPVIILPGACELVAIGQIFLTDPATPNRQAVLASGAGASIIVTVPYLTTFQDFSHSKQRENLVLECLTIFLDLDQIVTCHYLLAPKCWSRRRHRYHLPHLQCYLAHLPYNRYPLLPLAHLARLVPFTVMCADGPHTWSGSMRCT